MAGPVPAIHVLLAAGSRDVDARHKAGHDEELKGFSMPLTLYYHPLSSYCHKVLIALYENNIAFTPHLVELQKPESRAAFEAVWPVGKFPVLRDETNGRVIPESTTTIEYLALRYPGPVKLIPDAPDAALDARALDRFFDLHVHTHMQRIIGERMRPADKKDPLGLAQAQAALDTALGIAEKTIAGQTWAAGDKFTIADCAAAPALFYIDIGIAPLAAYPNLSSYLARLKQRPSYARALAEAEPYMHMLPR
jgi:glutathione S-transferase